MDTTPASFPLDGSSLYFMAQAASDHTNVYRFTVTLAEPVCPQTLQQAADRIHTRFPTILAGFRPGPFAYQLVPLSRPPSVQPDPGLLRTMSAKEMADCAYRIYYRDTQLMIEVFHALTDGFGAIASLQALVGEYLYLRFGVHTPERESLSLALPERETEWEDGYTRYSSGPMASLPQRASYRIPGGCTRDSIQFGSLPVSTQALRQAAKQAGVSVTTLLSTLIAEAIWELQRSRGAAKKPVRIMVPVDLRRHFPSKTLRNFILYALPTLEPGDMNLSRRQRLLSFQRQLRQQMDRSFLAGQITRNQAIQSHPLFRLLPTAWKCALMRLTNRFFGETNSSITLTNLGPVNLSEAMAAHVRGIEVHLTPRRQSPYNCGLISYGDTTTITITRYGPHKDLERLFFGKLQSLLKV